jgi:hypothetical protein
MTREPDIPLNAREHELLMSLSFETPSHEKWKQTQPLMTELAQRLLRRNAIPEVRWRCFVDPDCNPGGRGRSRRDVFEKNGTVGDEILRHPNFLKYLEYFVFGPDLPGEIISKFKEAAASFGHLSGSDVLELAPVARALVRGHGLNPFEASEEFFRLALECGAAAWSADTLRKNIRAIRA